MIDPNAPDFLQKALAEVERRMNLATAGSTLWFRLFDASKSIEAAIASETQEDAA